MLFNAPEFVFLFLPITFFLFLLARRFGTRHQTAVLLVVLSLVFYSWWDISYLPLFALSLGINFLLANRILNSSNPWFRKTVLIVGIVGNLAFLAFYKYLNFLSGVLTELTGRTHYTHEYALPLAISFFTFQQLAYVIDAYRGDCQERSFINYCLFITFFPQLIAGPIVLHKEVIPHFNQDFYKSRLWENISVGVTIFLIGLFKKTIIADGVALYSTPLFEAAQKGPLGFIEGWSAALAYSFQLYFDFSAYGDMALGAARLFGITIPLNFYSPYKAGNIQEFWHRWHMTLSRFLKDYLYIPLGGNRRGRWRAYFNMLVVMVLGGIWHGAGWTFLVWGALHGGMLLTHRALKDSGWLPKSPGPLWKVSSQLLTFLLVIFAWVVFRADSLATAWRVHRAMLGLNGMGDVVSFAKGILIGGKHVADPEVIVRFLWFGVLLSVVWFLPNAYEFTRLYRPVLAEEARRFHLHRPGFLKRFSVWTPSFYVSLAIGVLLFGYIKILFEAKPHEFLYFNF